ncbi:MAG: glycosyltransferase [Planctomycetes bacterium]|nr:glycosyltransferase [Planctomycetota bacterium]
MAAERRLRVALLEPAGRGGIHHYSRALADALAQAGAAVTLFTARNHEFAAADRAQPPCFAIEPRFERRRTDPVALLRALRRATPDVLHLQCGTHPLLHLALLHAARAATGVRAVVTAHDLQPKNSGRFGAWLAARLHRAADAVIVHGERLRGALATRQPEVAARIAVVPHGDYEFLATHAPAITHATIAASNPPPTLLFFGYLHAEKGLEDLIAAMPTIVAAQPLARLVIAGKPEQAIEPLREQARALRVDACIDWHLGYVAQEAVAPLFAAATAVVLPYRAASQSGVVFLAGAYGKPLIATRVGALPESIAHGEGGLLVPPRAPAALAAAAIELLADRGRAAEMGKKHAFRCRTEGAWTAIADRTLDLYARLTGIVAPRAAESVRCEADARQEGVEEIDRVRDAREAVLHR